MITQMSTLPTKNIFKAQETIASAQIAASQAAVKVDRRSRRPRRVTSVPSSQTQQDSPIPSAENISAMIDDDNIWQ
jgi:hypothetical protein